MNRVFYRYIRPVKFATHRLEFDTLPNGGVCLRFERNADGTTLFTYSRCHADDHFNKYVAKYIADERAFSAKTDARLMSAMSPDMGGVGENAELLARFVISYCRAFDPVDHPFLIAHYLSIEWRGFADALERIVKHNEKQREIGATWITAAHAMGVAQLYEDKAA